MQQGFSSSLKIRALTKAELKDSKASRQLFEVLEDFPYVTAKGICVTVPKHFISDFASVPHMTKFLIDDDDPDILYPSLIHDFLYFRGGKIQTATEEGAGLAEVSFSREDSDKILREAMQHIGSPAWKYIATYRAVRLMGGWFWKS